MYIILSISFSVLAILSTRLINKNILLVIPYLFFFISPILTYFGVIGALTGFDRIYTSSLYFGISFYTVNIAHHLLKSREIIKSNPFYFILSIVNPLYLFTGPFPDLITRGFKKNNLKLFLIRLEIINSELILGIFFALILAPSFLPFFHLKESSEILDIIFFGIIFELFVYFNFAGFSMIAWSFMRLFGINVKKNFNQPFSATSIVEYWQRWHISLSNILKDLFFKKLKVKIGLYNSVFIVFLASALWHGATLNFLIWGSIHSLFWCISYFFHKNNFKFLNYFLLFFGVVIGRIIFSESSTDFLLIKIKTLFDFSRWNITNNIGTSLIKIGNINLYNVIIAFFLIFLEITMPRFFKLHKNYVYLKTPIISTLILLYACLFFRGLNFEPIYGGR